VGLGETSGSQISSGRKFGEAVSLRLAAEGYKRMTVWLILCQHARTGLEKNAMRKDRS
jgi:hypothetical protein